MPGIDGGDGQSSSPVLGEQVNPCLPGLGSARVGFARSRAGGSRARIVSSGLSLA